MMVVVKADDLDDHSPSRGLTSWSKTYPRKPAPADNEPELDPGAFVCIDANGSNRDDDDIANLVDFG